MRQLKCLLIVTFLVITTLNTKGSTTEFLSEINLFNLQNDTVQHFVGEFFGGGVVFYVNASKHHGLICSMSNIRDPRSSRSNKNQDSRAIKDLPESKVLLYQDFAVDKHDRAIEISDNYTNSNYGSGIYSNWYLPTIDELKILYNVKNEINKTLLKFGNNVTDPLVKTYWSSTKIHNDLIDDYFRFDFNLGEMVLSTTLPGITIVRAIRAF